ncbi:MAG: DegV family protein [Lachnospiraceae bacterium]|nr:DegV family protein [Lachnospiraceae bacterium]
MKKIGITTDSHSSITPELAKELGVLVLPAPFSINDQLYHEGVDLTRQEFFKLQLEGADIVTSQPSPGEVMDFWDQALTEYEQIIYIPISSGLSGSYGTAALLAQDEKYEDKVFVVDNGRVSTPLHCTVLDALKMVEDGLDAAAIKATLEKFAAQEVIYVAIDNIEHLKKGGRISPGAALVASVLNIKPVMMFDTGSIDVFQKCRGMKKAKKAMFDAVRKDLETRFKDWYEKGDFYLMTATAVSEEDDRAFVEEVKKEFPGIPVLSDELALGTCCHIGYGGLGIGISCKPRY